MSKLASDQNYTNLVVKQTLVVQGVLTAFSAQLGLLYVSQQASLGDVTCTSLTISGDHSADNIIAASTLNAGDQILAADGVAGHPAIAFTSDNTTGLYLQGTDEIAIAAGGVRYASLGTQAIQAEVPVLGFISTEGTGTTATIASSTILGGSYNFTGATTGVLPTAALLVAALTSPVATVGTTVSCYFGAGTGTSTIACGSGGAWANGATTLSIPVLQFALVTIRFTNVTSGTEAYHAYATGTSTVIFT